jgi:hypothetical protein
MSNRLSPELILEIWQRDSLIQPVSEGGPVAMAARVAFEDRHKLLDHISAIESELDDVAKNVRIVVDANQKHFDRATYQYERAEAAEARVVQLEAKLAESTTSTAFWRDGWHALDQDKKELEAKLADADVKLLNENVDRNLERERAEAAEYRVSELGRNVERLRGVMSAEALLLQKGPARRADTIKALRAALEER